MRNGSADDPMGTLVADVVQSQQAASAAPSQAPPTAPPPTAPANGFVPGNESGAPSDESATGPVVHTVEEGQHISAIAASYGVANFETVWNAPENARLRAVRDDPHQLLAGDQIVIPAKKPKKFERDPGKTHEFRVHVEKLKLRLRVLDLTGRPIANQTGVLIVDEIKKQITTDDGGVVCERIPRSAKQGRLEIGGYVFDLAIGELGPVSEPYGQSCRLMNLGLWRANTIDANDIDAHRLAIELLQRQRKVRPDGAMSSDVIEMLSDEHDGEA